MNKKTRILLIDNQALFREGLKCLLSREKDFQVVGDLSPGRQVISSAVELEPDLIVTDVDLDHWSGFEVLRNISPIVPSVSVVFLAGHASDMLIATALRERARGYFLKSDPVSVLIDGLRKVRASENLVAPQSILERLPHILTRALGKRTQEPSPRELEVVMMYAKGERTSDVARALGLSPKTIDSYRMHIKDKLGLKRSAEYRQYCRDMDLIRESGDIRRLAVA